MVDVDTSEHHVTLHITCQHPPVDWSGFGLQDKTQALQPPTHKQEDSWVFTCEVRVKWNEKLAIPNFLGEFAHGTPQERFLYLSLRAKDGAADAWIRRIKVPLKSISWEQVIATVEQGDMTLACTVDGTKTGTVQPADGWQVVKA